MHCWNNRELKIRLWEIKRKPKKMFCEWNSQRIFEVVGWKSTEPHGHRCPESTIERESYQVLRYCKYIKMLRHSAFVLLLLSAFCYSSHCYLTFVWSETFKKRYVSINPTSYPQPRAFDNIQINPVLYVNDRNQLTRFITKENVQKKSNSYEMV